MVMVVMMSILGGDGGDVVSRARKMAVIQRCWRRALERGLAGFVVVMMMVWGLCQLVWLLFIVVT